MTSQLPNTLETSFVVPQALNRGGGRFEEDDSYPCLVRFGDRRVIVCKDDWQWILQRFDGKRWVNISYHLNRDVLIERSAANGSALDVLRSLPAPASQANAEPPESGEAQRERERRERKAQRPETAEERERQAAIAFELTKAMRGKVTGRSKP